jgi:hypothetical protein
MKASIIKKINVLLITFSLAIALVACAGNKVPYGNLSDKTIYETNDVKVKVTQKELYDKLRYTGHAQLLDIFRKSPLRIHLSRK